MVPEHRRDELGRDGDREVRRDGGGAEDREQGHGRHGGEIRNVGNRRHRLRDTRLEQQSAHAVGVRREDRLVGPRQQVEFLEPRVRARDERRHDGEQREADEADDGRSQASGEHGPAKHKRGLQLDRRAERGGDAERPRSIHPPPPNCEQQQEQRPHLAELDRVQDRPRQGRQQEDRELHPPRDRHERHRGSRRGEQQHRPHVDAEVAREQGDRRDEQGERRRIQEQAKPADHVDRRVVQRPTGNQSINRQVVRPIVVAERARSGRRLEDQDHPRHRSAQRDGIDGAEEQDPQAGGHRRFRTDRCSSGMRKRSQATRRARPTRGRMRDPRTSSQRTGTIAMR